MIICKSVFRIDRLFKYTNPCVLQNPGLYSCNGLRFDVNMAGRKEFWSTAEEKKRKTVNRAWRPVSTQASPSEDSLVKEDKNESDDGSHVQEMHYRMHSSTVGAQHVAEVAELMNAITDPTVGSSAFPKNSEDADLEGQSMQSSKKFSVSMSVGSSLIRFVRGKGGSIQERIEEQMGVKILIPSSKKEDFVVIEGNSVDSITRASEKIQSIIDEAIKSPSLDYSHFVSLPLAIHPELVEKLINFQNSILGNSDSCLFEIQESDSNEENTDNENDQPIVKAPDAAIQHKVDDESKHTRVNMNIPLISYPPKASKSSTSSDLGIEKSIFIKPKTFHLTVLMLKLWNKERVDAASEVLKGISSKILDALDNKPVVIRLKGLDCMRGSLAKAGVLYTPVEEIGNEGRLFHACQVIINAFTEAGLVLEKDAKQKLKLHATVMNVRHRKRSRRQKKFDSFDARDIFKQYGSENWGEYLIREAHLSQRFVFDENGYYHCCASVPFPENMQVD